MQIASRVHEHEAMRRHVQTILKDKGICIWFGRSCEGKVMFVS